MKTTRAMAPHQILRHSAAISMFAAATLIIPTARAEEGGAGHVAPGGMATLIDLAPTKPGWVVETMLLHYQGDVSAGQNLPVGGLLTANLDATSDALMLGGLYTLEQQIFGAHYSFGGFLPYVWADIDARVTLGPLAGYHSESAEGIGDLLLLPVMMAWRLDCWQINAILPVYAPTGDYDVGRLANPGMNHWTFDPTLGAAYGNEKTGLNFAVHGGFAISTKNNDTDYRNGTVFHLDTSVQQLLPLGPGFLCLGVEAFYYQQIGGDNGRGATQGDFKGRTAGIGPVLGYILPVGDKSLVAELRWLPELDTRNRVEGDYFWFKLVYQF